MTRNRLMLLVAIMASVVVAVGGFFIGVQPQLASARASDQQRATTEAANTATQTQIAALTEENKTLDQKKAALAVLQGSIPSSLNQSDFYRELYDIASANGVTISSLTTSDAQAYAPPQTAPAAGTTPSSTASSSSSPSSTPSPTATPSTPAAPKVTTNSKITSANFSAVPVTVGIDGSFAQAIAFMKGAQSGKRLFLVNAVSSTASSSTGSSSTGSGKTADASTTWTLSGFIYVLEDASSTQSEQAAASATKG